MHFNGSSVSKLSPPVPTPCVPARQIQMLGLEKLSGLKVQIRISHQSKPLALQQLALSLKTSQAHSEGAKSKDSVSFMSDEQEADSISKGLITINKRV